MNKQMMASDFDIPPYALQNTQEWFASIITTPLAENDTIRAYSPAGMLIAEEAGRYIVPSPTLRPHQRMQIYNQQYWWRLLNTLHINFPLVTRLFGQLPFNERIAIPYLLQCPPSHWSLSEVGEKLPGWIFEHYQDPDKSLIYHSAELDWAFTASFIAPQLTPVDLASLVKEDPENLLTYPLYLQPHIHLFMWDFDLMNFRHSFLQQDIDYWVENPFPELPKGKTYRFILYRNARNNPAWRPISKAEHLLLKCYKNGSTTQDACQLLESQDSEIFEEAAANLQKWLQEWTQLGWLTLERHVN